MIDVMFTMKSGVQIKGCFDWADSLDELPLSSEWVHSNGEFEAIIKSSEIAAIEVLARYS